LCRLTPTARRTVTVIPPEKYVTYLTPQPTRERHEQFCKVEGWDCVRDARGRTGTHHVTYELGLAPQGPVVEPAQQAGQVPMLVAERGQPLPELKSASDVVTGVAELDQ
jgi:hypothetical protein